MLLFEPKAIGLAIGAGRSKVKHMDARQKLVVHEGLTQLQEMRLEMLRNVVWRVLILPVALLCAAALLAVVIAWFFVAFVSPLLQLRG